MVENLKGNIVPVIEGRNMDASQVKSHLSEVYSEALLLTKEFGRVSLLIDAQDKEFKELEARRSWSLGIRNFPSDIIIHKVAFIVLPEDLEATKICLSNMQESDCFTNVSVAKNWLEQEL